MKRAALLFVVFVAAGCGGAANQPGQPLPHALAQRWAQHADAIAAAKPCAAQQQAAALRTEVILAVNKHKVPQHLLEPLTSKVNALAGHTGCAPVKGEAQNLAGWLRDASG
jgi:hypothetical protein